jgi:ABC-2 type transport system ATP-binding protein
MPSALSFSELSKKFGPMAALSDVSFAVEPGEFFGLVGVNGAGKTTLIKCLLDFCALDSGSIEICGITHRLPHARKNLVFLPERFTPPHYLTGRDFLDLMRRLHGAQYGDADVATLLDGLDFSPEALKKPVRSLSKGMTQKLGLAAMLLAAKPILVLDEPMSGLDPRARALLKLRLRELRRSGATVFFTSHQLTDIDELADHMAILHGGQLRYCGSPQELRSTTGATDLEASFLRVIA